jgi:hypothetical protein
MTDWPRCPNCGDYALDGQATCGRPWCEKVLQQEQRENRGFEHPCERASQAVLGRAGDG